MTTGTHDGPDPEEPRAPRAEPESEAAPGPGPGPVPGAAESYGAAVFRTLDRNVRLTLYRLLAVPLAVGLVLAVHPWTWGGSSGSSVSDGYGSDAPFSTGGTDGDGTGADGTATDDTSVDTGDGTDTAGDSSVTDEPSPTEDPQSEAAALDALVAQSADERTQVSAAVADAGQCGPDAGLSSDAATLQNAADARTSLAQQATGLTMDAVTGGSDAAQLLSTALDASAAADADYARWATALADGSCSPSSTHRQSDYLAGGQDSTTAQQAKAAFVDAWNPIAEQYGLTTRDTDEF